MKAFLLWGKLLLINLILLVISHSAYCTDYTWKIGAANSNWTDVSNWTPTPAGTITSFTSTDNIIIVNASNAPVISSNQTIGKLTVSSGSLTINAGVTLNVGGVTIISAGTSINGSGQLNLGSTSTSVTSITIGGTATNTAIACSVYGNTASLSVKKTTFSAPVSFKAAASVAGQGGNTFNSPLTLESSGSSSIKFGDSAGDTFNDLTLISTVGLINLSSVNNSFYNGNIVVRSSGQGVYFGQGGATSGNSTLATGKTISAQNFTAGALTLRNFIQSDSATAQSIILDTAATSTGIVTFASGTEFKGVLTAKAPEVVVSGGTYYNNCFFTKSGSATTSSSGVVTFKGDVTYNSKGGIWYICPNAGLHRFEGNVYIYKTSNSLFSVANNTAGSAEFVTPGKKILVSNGGTGGTISIALGGKVLIKGDVVFRSSSAGATIFGGGDTITVDTGASLSIDSTQFTAGGVTFKGVIQKGKKKQTLISNYGVITFSTNTTFNGVVNVRFPSINFNGTVFMDSVIANKTGGTTSSDGGCSFFGPALLTSSGNGLWYLANVNPDKFYNNVTFTKNSSLVFDVVRTATSEFYKNVTFNGINTIDPIIGSVGGKMAFKGDSAQTLTYDKSTFIRLDNIILNKTSNHVTLNANVQVNGSIQFVKGNLITSASKIIKINTTNITGASSLSYIEGPAQKLGTTAFTFPIGKSGIYKPITISAPLSSDVVTAEVFNAVPPNTSLLSTSITSIALCQYWQIGRTLATSLVVTIPWDLNTCTTVNPSVVKLARFNGTQWIDASSGAGTGTSSSGSITSSNLTITGANNYFTFGNLVQAILKINTVNVNTGSFTITGPGMVALDTLSGLPSSFVTVKPDLPASGTEKSIVLSIPQTTERKSLEMRVSYNNSSAITKVEAKFDNQYFPLNSDFYRIKNTNELHLYKEAPEPEVMTISTNLKNGILLDTTGIFQINIPSNTVFSGSSLSVYNITGTTPVQVYGPQSVLTWNASSATAGVYEFQLQLIATGGTKIYKGQFIKE